MTDDGFLHAVPYVAVMSGKSRDDAGKTIRNLDNDIFQSENFTDRQLSKRGGYPTKLISFHHAIELAMILPGKLAKETRTGFANIIRRYLAGDGSLVKEIQDNAASSSPIAQMARASMGNPDLDQISKKRQLERDDMLFEMEMAERKQRLLHATVETQAKTVSIQKTLRDEYAALCPDQIMDDRARVMFKDSLLNIAFPQGIATAVQVIGNGIPAAVPEDTRPLTISSFALEEGKRYDTKALQRIGGIMSSLYQKKYGARASQHEQFTDGAVRVVRSYTRKDQDLLKEAFRLFEAQNFQ